ncbi:type I-E CRISPR-associated endoribonuclease Cas2e [Streptomyces sp. DT24]|uniref:type I-E CRISPR-associated endoribonuclease Cas2e n=1 Tax=unclassified Streptomyces TaxID=2593676 RepID=UPI003CFA67A0
MTVIVLTNCPSGLRGFLTRWLLEISPGVFLGSPSKRVRDVLWTEVRAYADQGRALLAYQTDNEQGYAFETHDHGWHPTDNEGVTLIHRPARKARTVTATAAVTTYDDADAITGGETSDRPARPPRQGWSKAAKRRKFGGRGK